MKKLIVNKTGLVNNLNIITSIIGDKTNIIAVVKANGMGLDLIQYAEFLINNGIDMLAVANVEEAIKIRQAGIEKDILMLSEVNLAKDLELLIKNNIILTIGSSDEMDLIKQISNELETNAKVHLKIDTGFARYGFLYTEPNKILDIIKIEENVQIVGMYTHFSKSTDEKWTRLQFKRFCECVEIVKEFLKTENINNDLICHCCNTTAALKYSDMRLDAVRIGSGIQGRVLKEFLNLKLKKIGILETKIIKIKELPKDYNVSYSNEYRTKRKTTIAVIPVRIYGWHKCKKSKRYL